MLLSSTERLSRVRFALGFEGLTTAMSEGAPLEGELLEMGGILAGTAAVGPETFVALFLFCPLLDLEPLALANSSEVPMAGATLEGATLEGTTLEGAMLDGGWLAGILALAILVEVPTAGATLEGATLDGGRVAGMEDWGTDVGLTAALGTGFTGVGWTP